MKNDIIVFQEQRFHFGINPGEFEESFSLNSAWISPANESDRLWRFERKERSIKGDFIHFGALLGLTSAYFNNASQIFMKKTPDGQVLGLCISGTLFQISLNGTKEKLVSIDESVHIPETLPQTIFSRLLRYKRKTIYIVDPILLFRAYHLIFTSRFGDEPAA